jgi:hypothetical protein
LSEVFNPAESGIFNHLIIIDARDYMHRAIAPGTDQRISFINFLDEPGPILPEGLVSQLRLQDAGNSVSGKYIEKVHNVVVAGLREFRTGRQVPVRF